MKKTINYARKYAKDFNFLTWLYQIYAAYVLFLPFFNLFYSYKITRNKALEKKPYIFAGNHISYLDPFVLTCVAGNRPLAYMAKKELFESSNYVAKNIWRLGAFAVNREKLEVSTIKSCIEVFKANFNLCIFPQGGIRKNKKIEQINKGFVAVAKLVKADIVPVAMTGYETYNWNIFKRPKVKLHMGEPISYQLDEDEIVKRWSEQIVQYTGYELVTQ